MGQEFQDQIQKLKNKRKSQVSKIKDKIKQTQEAVKLRMKRMAHRHKHHHKKHGHKHRGPKHHHKFGKGHCGHRRGPPEFVKAMIDQKKAYTQETGKEWPRLRTIVKQFKEDFPD
eukprot:TRINITY_DN63450_c0_g1_i1.p1 TRINITY_DN63450_c0_g1~~TRINITY_DN63450_c0_g1_i1.p1  ORF type:complete len:115 (-),score=14.42 TRINITY_DN63450_c0_g1_i1:55-399(-)